MAVLAEFNVEQIPMGAEEIVMQILEPMRPVVRKGLECLSEAAQVCSEEPRLKEVSELANNPTEHNEFLRGTQPIWADIQINRAISRECDEELSKRVLLL